MTAQKSLIVTRQSHCCPLFGLPKPMSENVLPTYSDMLLGCLEENYKFAVTSNSKKNPPFSETADRLASQIEAIYSKASIPTVSHTRIVQLIKKYHDAYYNLRKSYNRDKCKDSFKKKIEHFVSDGTSKLFDVAACKCKLVLSCSCGKKERSCDCVVNVDCSCEKKNKIPLLERRFMLDQRTNRVGLISAVDKKETEKLLKREDRKFTQFSREYGTDLLERVSSQVNNKKRFKNENTKQQPLPSTSTTITSLPQSSQMRLKLPATALVSDRFGVSDRATAAIASSVLEDLGLIKEGDMTLVVDKSKIRREKGKRRNTIKSVKEFDLVKAIYFDGRKDNTLVQEKIGSKMYRKVVKEEHISIIHEPGGNYIGHVTPVKGTGGEIAKCILEHLEKEQFNLNEIVAIGCDGTSTNTGWKNGVIRNIETQIGHPLQWFICLLHCNELPFRHLLEHLDGVTTGPSSFAGVIGKQLSDCEKLPIVTFEKITSEEIYITKDDLSKDQKYLLDIVQAIQKGECPPDLALKDPGPMSHSRWLTCANRVLRLYVSTECPSEELLTLTKYIVKTYAPVWFSIKKYPSVKFGPKHIYKLVQTSRFLNEDMLKIVDPVIQRNAFFRILRICYWLCQWMKGCM